MAFKKGVVVSRPKLRKAISGLTPVQPVDHSVSLEKTMVFASEKRLRRARDAKVKELMRDNEKFKSRVAEPFDGLRRQDTKYQVFRSDGTGYPLMGERSLPTEESYRAPDFEETRNIIAQRIARNEKAAPERKRRTK